MPNLRERECPASLPLSQIAPAWSATGIVHRLVTLTRKNGIRLGIGKYVGFGISTSFSSNSIEETRGGLFDDAADQPRLYFCSSRPKFFRQECFGTSFHTTACEKFKPVSLPSGNETGGCPAISIVLTTHPAVFVFRAKCAKTVLTISQRM